VTPGIAASDRVISVYPARTDAMPEPWGTGWVVLAVVAILLLAFFGTVWFFLGR